jgi:hypothetical protein
MLKLNKLLLSKSVIVLAIITFTLIAMINLNNFSLFESVFAQRSNIHLDYNSIEVSDTGLIQGKIIKENTKENSASQSHPINVHITAIGVGQTLVHCFHSEQKTNIVKSSDPFLASAQSSVSVSKDITTFTLYLQPTAGNIYCDNPSTVLRGPATVFSNVEVKLSQ